MEKILHPITGIVAAVYAALSPHIEFFQVTLSIVSGLIALIISVLSLANAWRNFRKK
jgi:predicted amino acid-binding ACT domain protein